MTDSHASLPHEATPPEAAPEAVRELLSVAEGLRNAGQYAEALTWFERILAEQPGTLDAELGASQCAAALGDHAAALRHAGAAATRLGKIWPLQRLAQTLRKEGEGDFARLAFKQAADLAPDRPEPSLGLAACARDAGDFATAAEAQGWAVSLAPHDVGAQLELARDLRRLGRIDDAVTLVTRVREADPDHPGALRLASQLERDRASQPTANTASIDHDEAALRARLQAADILRREARLDEAQAAYQAILADAPDQVGALLGLGRCHFAAGHVSDAKEAFLCATEISRKIGPLMHFATACRKAGEIEVARACCAEAAAIDPRAVEPLLGLAACARAERDFGLAERWQAKAVALVPTEAAALLALARDQLAGGRHDAARATVRDLLARHPRHGGGLALAATLAETPEDVVDAANAVDALAPIRPLLQLAADCRRDADVALAEVIYRRAAALAPDRPEPLRGLAACAEARGDRQAAARHTAAADALMPGRAGRRRVEPGGEAEGRRREPIKALMQRAAALRELGETEQSIAVIDAVLARQPDYAPALLARGQVLREQNEPKAAAAALALAHAAAPDDAGVLLAYIRALHEAGEAERGDALLDEALARGLAGQALLIYAAERALTLGDTGRALARADALVRAKPAQAQGYLLGTVALARRAEVTAALRRLDQADAACGPTPSLIVRRAQLLRQLGRPAEAAALCDHAREGFAAHFPLWEAAWHARLASMDAHAAARALDEAVPESEEQRAALLAMRGDAAMDRCEVGDALRHYEQAAALEPANAAYLNNVIRAHLARFDLPQAGAWLSRLDLVRSSLARRRARGGSSQQGFIETVYNDYRVDQAALAALRDLPQAPDQRLRALLPLARAYSDSTLLAACLLETAWQAGKLTAPKPGGSDIPRRLVQYWDAPPPDMIPLLEGWHEPDFPDRIRFDDKMARRFLGERCSQDVLFAYHRGVTPSVRADMFRLAVLAGAGGMYADAFSARLGPVSPLIEDGATLVLARGELGLLGTAFMAAAPGHPVLILARDLAAESINRGDRDLLWLATGPGLLTRAFARYLAEAPEQLDDRLARIRVWPRAALHGAIAPGCLSEWRATFQPRVAATTRRAYMLGGAG